MAFGEWRGGFLGSKNLLELNTQSERDMDKVVLENISHHVKINKMKSCPCSLVLLPCCPFVSFPSSSFVLVSGMRFGIGHRRGFSLIARHNFDLLLLKPRSIGVRVACEGYELVWYSGNCKS